MGKSLSELARKQILAEGPDIPSERDEWPSQTEYNRRCEEYIDEQLNDMTNAQLLERISDAIESK